MHTFFIYSHAIIVLINNFYHSTEQIRGIDLYHRNPTTSNRGFPQLSANSWLQVLASDTCITTMALQSSALNTLFERAAEICDYFIVCSVTVTQFHRILDLSSIQAAKHGFCFPRFKSLRSVGYKTFNRTEISQMGASKAREDKILLHLYFFLTSFRSWTRLKMLRTTTSLSSYLVPFDADISCCLPYLKLDLCTHTRTNNRWLGPNQLIVIVLKLLVWKRCKFASNMCWF